MNQPLFQKNNRLLLLTAIVLWALFYNLGSVPLFDEDEGAYAEVSLEMLKSGDWITPRLAGQPFFHKPPVIYWTQAASVALLGPSEFAFRLPSVLASLAWALLLFIFVRRRMDQETAGFTVFFLVSTIQLCLITRSALADAFLNLFITLTLFAVFAYFEEQRKRHIITAFAAMGLGFMTKGPIAIVIPLVVSFLFFLSEKSLDRWLRAVCHPMGWAVFFVIALPWYLALIHRFGWHFLQEIFMVHNFGRFRNAMEGHSGPIIYYIPVILIGMLPFTTVLLKAVSLFREQIKSSWMRYLWIWFGFVLVFFSIADTKLQHYIIYGYVPLLIFMANCLNRLKNRWLLALPAVLFLLPVLFLNKIAVWSLPHIADRFAALVVDSAMGELGPRHQMIILLILAGTVTAAAIPRWSIQLRTLVIGCLFIGLTSGHLIPLAGEIMQAPVKTAALLAKAHDYEVIMWQTNYPSFYVYYGKPALRKRKLSPGDIIITKANKMDSNEAYQIIYRKHGIVLARISSLPTVSNQNP